MRNDLNCQDKDSARMETRKKEKKKKPYDDDTKCKINK
jgi:hypothetical protein